MPEFVGILQRPGSAAGRCVVNAGTLFLPGPLQPVVIRRHERLPNVLLRIVV